MSSIVQLNSLMHDTECLAKALTENGESISVKGTTIELTSQWIYRATFFELTNTGYKLNTDSHNTKVLNPDWLKKVHYSYEGIYQKKLERLAEIERAQLEEGRKKFVVAQEQKIIEKAKKLGYKIDKRMEKDNNIQLVLIKRIL